MIKSNPNKRDSRHGPGQLRPRGRYRWAVVFLGLWLFASSVTSSRAEPGAASRGLLAGQPTQLDADTVSFFTEQVRPILLNRCIKCHGGEKLRGEFNMADAASFFAGGESGDVFDTESHGDSALLVAISYSDIDREMPPTGKMPQDEIDVLEQWVLSGAPWPNGEAGQLAEGGAAEAVDDGPMTPEEGRNYWAYRAVERPDIPQVDNADWNAHPIDALIFARLAQAGLQPNALADRQALIRRATYDLTGLPPTPREVEAFINNEAPDAYEQLIDRLLASPHYGEKWARHWLDVVRYAETDGYERDGKKQNMWRYRDYVIRSFNDDKPYDRFITEQLAGDELSDGDGQSLIATGFMRLQIWDDEPTDAAQARADYLADIVDTTTAAFLGSTLGCARCHDHKKDPFLQADYYQLFAFFNHLTQPQRGNAAAIVRDVPAPAMPVESPGPFPASVVAELGAIGPEQAIHMRGSANSPGDRVAPSFPLVLGGGDASYEQLPATTGRRLALSQWIASPDNPLTARVMVNRLWQYHFGRGLVRSSSDFGTLGTGVTHPLLLDHLASEFVDRDWSIKQMHKYIMMSRAYRMSSAASDNALATDPINNFFWRFNMRRLSAEEVRDSILAINGALNAELFGPEVYPPLPDEVIATASRPHEAWGESTPEQSNRRSIYIHVKRSMRDPLLFAFDQAETDSPCPVRFETTVPTQSLIALNSEFMQREAEVFAQRLKREAGDDREAQVKLALSLVLMREPTDHEIAENLAFIADLQAEHGVDDAAAMRLFCVVCFNLNEFMYLD